MKTVTLLLTGYDAEGRVIRSDVRITNWKPTPKGRKSAMAYGVKLALARTPEAFEWEVSIIEPRGEGHGIIDHTEKVP